MAKRYYNGKKTGSMVISEDLSKPAGMPTEVIMKDFPPCPYGGAGYTYGDTLDAADSQMKEDIKFFNRKGEKTKI